MHAIFHAGDGLNMDGGVSSFVSWFALYPLLHRVFADRGYRSATFEQGVAQYLTPMQVEIVKRSNTAKVFVILPRRWEVERTFAWIGRCPRPAKHFDNRTRNALSFLKLVSIRLARRK